MDSGTRFRGYFFWAWRVSDRPVDPLGSYATLPIFSKCPRKSPAQAGSRCHTHRNHFFRVESVHLFGLFARKFFFLKKRTPFSTSTKLSSVFHKRLSFKWLRQPAGALRGRVRRALICHNLLAAMYLGAIQGSLLTDRFKWVNSSLCSKCCGSTKCSYNMLCCGVLSELIPSAHFAG